MSFLSISEGVPEKMKESFKKNVLFVKIYSKKVNFCQFAKNRPNFAGDFGKNLIASMTLKIAQMAKIRHGWERWATLLSDESG